MDSPRRFIAYVVDPDRLGTTVSHLKTPRVLRKGTASLDAPGKIPLDETHERIAAFHRAHDLRHLFVELPLMNDLTSYFHVQRVQPFCLHLEDPGPFGIIPSSLSTGPPTEDHGLDLQAK